MDPVDEEGECIHEVMMVLGVLGLAGQLSPVWVDSRLPTGAGKRIEESGNPCLEGLSCPFQILEFGIMSSFPLPFKYPSRDAYVLIGTAGRGNVGEVVPCLGVHMLTWFQELSHPPAFPLQKPWAFRALGAVVCAFVSLLGLSFPALAAGSQAMYVT